MADLDTSQFHTVWEEGFDDPANSIFTRRWGGGIDNSVPGQLTVRSTPDWSDSGAMIPPWGPAESGNGYGLYTARVAMDNDSGPYLLTWPGTDRWPGPEYDMVEIHQDGTPYSTIHWRGEGNTNEFTSHLLEGVDPQQFHTYQMHWHEVGGNPQIDFYVDGVHHWTQTENVGRDFAHGGENTAMGIGMQNWWNMVPGDDQDWVTIDYASYAAEGSGGGAPPPTGEPPPRPEPEPPAQPEVPEVPGNQPTTTEVGAGADALVLRVSQQWYGGNAELQVLVDGEAVAAVPVSALHGQGADTVTIRGDFGPGEHTVSFRFADAFDPNADWSRPVTADRNVFIESATFNGVAVPGAQLGLYNEASPNSFTLAGAGSGPEVPTEPETPGEPAPAGVDLSKYDLTFADEFNGTRLDWNSHAAVDWPDEPQEGQAANGTWATKYWWGTGMRHFAGEQQEFVDPGSKDDPFSVKNGILTIQPKVSTDRAATDGQAFASGMITTEGTFSQKYGYFEMRADMPEGVGAWPAFWMLPQDHSYPPELDVVEMPGSEPGVVHHNVHGVTDADDRSGSAAMEGVGDGFHTFAVDWTPEQVTFFVDGQQTYQAATPASLDKAMYLLASYGVGGEWPGYAAEGAQMEAMQIDYIRAYALKDGEEPEVPVDPEPPTEPEPAERATVTGGAGKDTLQLDNAFHFAVDGGAGRDVISLGANHGDVLLVFHAGQIKGDLVAGFDADAGDALEFHGFGEGATVKALGNGGFRVSDAEGHSEKFTLLGVDALAASDFTFV